MSLSLNFAILLSVNTMRHRLAARVVFEAEDSGAGE